MSLNHSAKLVKSILTKSLVLSSQLVEPSGMLVKGLNVIWTRCELAGDHGLQAAVGAAAAAVLGLGGASAGGNLSDFRADLDKLDTVMYKIAM